MVIFVENVSEIIYTDRKWFERSFYSTGHHNYSLKLHGMIHDFSQILQRLLMAVHFRTGTKQFLILYIFDENCIFSNLKSVIIRDHT